MLRKLYPADPWVELHPEEAERLRIGPDDWVIIESRRGYSRARARVTSTIAQGQAFVPMHDPTMNRLTLDTFDPHSRQPAYKHCAVRLVKA